MNKDGKDGKCVDPSEAHPLCANYYGDLEFAPTDLIKAGLETVHGKIRAPAGRVRVNRVRSGPVTRFQPLNAESNNLLEELLRGPEVVEEPVTRQPPSARRFRPRPVATEDIFEAATAATLPPPQAHEASLPPTFSPLAPVGLRNWPQNILVNNL